MKLIRVILFCSLCAVILAGFSGLMKDWNAVWKDHLMLILTITFTYALTILFVKWEKLQLRDVGVVASNRTFKKLAIGFGIGMVMAMSQPAYMLLAGHYKMVITASFSFNSLLFYCTLYILAALREELAFRGYPLFSLNYSYGIWISQLVILVIFSLEHVAGGMTWIQAFLGAGTGALLFGFAALRTNGIALPFGLHFAWNFGQWMLGFKKETGLFTGITEKGFENTVEQNAWISYLIIMTVAIVAFYFYRPPGKFINKMEP